MAPMSQTRKYAALPDLDEAPDIYETPELTDDASTLQTSTTARSPSPSVSEGSEAGISRRRLQPDDARSQFDSSRVDARDADFSDRLSDKRRAYRVSSRRIRGRMVEKGDEESDSEDDEEEGLQRRLARLRREIHEVQAEVERREAQGENHGGEEQGVAAELRDVSAALDKLRTSQQDAGAAHARLARQLANGAQTEPVFDAAAPRTNGNLGETRAVDTADTQTLIRVAAFDTRLASLERALGISALDTSPGLVNTGNTFTPVLPTLTLLDRQLSLLTTSPSSPHLDTLLQKLQQAQPTAAPLQPQNNNNTEPPSALSAEDMAKLRSLYALLPTLNSMAPTLPLLLERLRSLRTLHASAASASQVLDEVERKQDEADKEIKDWTEGLRKVEEAVKGAEKGMRENAGVVEGWVKNLEGRVQKLG